MKPDLYLCNECIINFQSLIFGLSIYEACPVCTINLSDTFSTACTLIWGRRNALVPTTPAFSLNIHICFLLHFLVHLKGHNWKISSSSFILSKVTYMLVQ